MPKTTRRTFIAGTSQAAMYSASIQVPGPAEESGGPSDRHYWTEIAQKLARPVLAALAQGELKVRLPASGDWAVFAPLEAFGRLLEGIAPWLELGGDATPEGRERAELAVLARQALRQAVDPESPDFMNFTEGMQPLVDAAFLAQAILRSPVQLWQESDSETQRNLVRALVSTRRISPHYNNWLLFSAMIEATLYKLGLEWDHMRVDLALRTVENWYLGDGIYGDGPEFHWDYYNSFVIQPFLLDILETFQRRSEDLRQRYERVRRISRRYAAILERLISPEGTYPAIGRSIAYRFGAFQLLSQVALRNELPDRVSPAQVRGALSAVIRRQMEAPGTFDGKGWLTVGFCGNQPNLGEGYISAGSVYLCAAGLVALGLPPSHPFWTDPAEDWTSRKIWAGDDMAWDAGLYGLRP